MGNRLRVTESLTTDVGLRYHMRPIPGRDRLRPRISAAYQISPQTTLRAAWGHYAQAQGLHELQIADGDTLFYPAQDAEHRILGIEHFPLRESVDLRLEAFQRLTSDPFPEYRNLVDRVEAVWEEGPGDRVGVVPERRKAQGIEFLAKGPLGPLGCLVGELLLFPSGGPHRRGTGSPTPRPAARHSAQSHREARSGMGFLDGMAGKNGLACFGAGVRDRDPGHRGPGRMERLWRAERNQAPGLQASGPEGIPAL